MKLNADLLIKALKFADKAHEGQLRKFQDVPYVWHAISVAKLVEFYKPTSVNPLLLRIAALLHDTVEDTDATLNDIVSEFGFQVASLVDELTSDKEESNRLGKTKYLSSKLKHMSSYALTIKLCDRLDNVMDLVMVQDTSFRNKYINETVSILMSLEMSRELTSTQSKIVSKINEVIKYT